MANHGRRMGLAAGVALATAACAGWTRPDGESYATGGDPWEQDAQPASAPAGSGGTAPDEGVAEPRATAGAKGLTVLEQLDAASKRVTELELENAALQSDRAGLTALIEQLKRENANLAQLAEAGNESRAAIDLEIERLREAARVSETRCLSLADELLLERIQRVRIERKLLEEKVAQAEQEDGRS